MDFSSSHPIVTILELACFPKGEAMRLVLTEYVQCDREMLELHKQNKTNLCLQEAQRMVRETAKRIVTE